MNSTIGLQSVQFRPVGKGSTLAVESSLSVSLVDYSCLKYYNGQTIQRRQDPLSSTGPEVLLGLHSGLFISFKKRHTSDIRPATLSSWPKQTILMCYKQADQQALDLVEVKAHDLHGL